MMKEEIKNFYKKIEEEKENGYYVCSIWIEKDEGFIDIVVWDEMENERREDLGMLNFFSEKEAIKGIKKVIEQNPNITFVEKKF